MRHGRAVYIAGFTPFSAHAAATITAEIAHLIDGKTSALVAALFFTLVLAAQAQQSGDEVAVPAWTEPTLPSNEPAAPSTETAPLPSAQEPLPSTPAEPLPASSAPLPSSEEAFPSSSDPWSSSGNY